MKCIDKVLPCGVLHDRGVVDDRIGRQVLQSFEEFGHCQISKIGEVQLRSVSLKPLFNQTFEIAVIWRHATDYNYVFGIGC